MREDHKSCYWYTGWLSIQCWLLAQWVSNTCAVVQMETLREGPKKNYGIFHWRAKTLDNIKIGKFPLTFLFYASGLKKGGGWSTNPMGNPIIFFWNLPWLVAGGNWKMKEIIDHEVWNLLQVLTGCSHVTIYSTNCIWRCLVWLDLVQHWRWSTTYYHLVTEKSTGKMMVDMRNVTKNSDFAGSEQRWWWWWVIISIIPSTGGASSSLWSNDFT